MIMRKNTILLLAVAVLLAGCLKDAGPSDADLITIEASIGPQTKVDQTNGGVSSSFEKGDQIVVFAWTGSASPVPTTRVVDGVVNLLGSGGWSPASLMRWKSMSSTHYFLGVSPVHTISSFTADPYTLDPGQYTASDLLVATTPSGITPTKSPISLEFSHVMAKLIVNLTFRSQWSSAPTVSSVTVNARTTGTVDYLAKQITATGAASGVSLTMSDNASWHGLQIPQEGVKTITVQIEGKDYVYNYPDDAGIPLKSGKYTTINLNVGRDKIELDGQNIKITDWESGTPIEGSTVRAGGPFSLDAYFPADLLPGRNGWQNGDEIFVLCQVEGKSFVDNTDVKHLKMTYNGTAWSVAEMQNATATPGCLGLADGDQVSMRAVYLPYGQDVSVTADGKGGYAFNAQTYDCYLTAPLNATVSGGTLSGSFDLALPAGAMLFSMENDNNYSGSIELREPHLTPLGLTGFTADLGAVSADPVHGAPVQGHSTSPVYAFYATPDGDLSNVWADYHFTQVREGGNYYGYDKHLALSGASSRVLALPALGSSDWKSLTYKPIDLGIDIDDPVRGGKKRIYWASCNVGATAPEEFGDCFAWGETTKKAEYVWSTLQYCVDGSGNKFSKYVSSDKAWYWGGEGSPDNRNVLDAEDDAATVNWGAPWRTPTDAEWTALLDEKNCASETTTQNGVKGRLFTSKKTGATLFLPAAGFRGDGTHLHEAGSYGGCWSSSLNTNKPSDAWFMFFSALGGIDIDFSGRRYGLSIRPVTE